MPGGKSIPASSSGLIRRAGRRIVVAVNDIPKAAAERAISVTQLLRRIRNILEINVGDVWIEGEVSNLRKQASGHWYFSLKDETAQIQCAMFGARRREGFEALEDGAKVRVFAETTVYEARGQLQVIVKKAERAGHGDLQARFEALKRKLADEGLFDAARKKSLPPFPATIGIVTSPTGAAIQDILNVLGRRAPWVRPVLFPVRVQGAGAEREIAAAIRQLGDPETYGHPRCDVLIVGRGGGSLEDLWCFNEEIVARAIAACPIPVISAVGHEIDFTIADFVADQRAPTPSAAAELAVPDTAALREKTARLHQRLHRHTDAVLTRLRLELQAIRNTLLAHDAIRPIEQWTLRVDSLHDQLATAARRAVDDHGHRLGDLATRHRMLHPARMLERESERAADLHARAKRAATTRLETHAATIARLRDILRTLGPESAFKRGFSVAMAPNGSIIRSASHAREAGEMTTRFLDGHVHSTLVPEPESPPTHE
jgi:exodeoxyribonuclease VII large subunit